jgi:phage-related protein
MTNATDPMKTTDLNPDEEQSKKVKEDLDQVLLTEQGLEEIKKNLDKMIDSMAQHPSYFSQAADFWGTIPLWQKIVAGVVLIVPTLILSMVIQSALLLAISIFSLIVFTASSLLLDNHHSQNVDRTEHLKVGLNGLANTLGVVILSLGKLREQLASEIEQFQLENAKLTINVRDLGEEIQELVEQRKLLQETEKALRKTNADLEQLSDSLKKSVKEHTQLLEQNAIQLGQVQLKYEQAESNLNEKISELKQVKKEMGDQIQDLGNFADSLQGVIETFLSKLRLDKEQQQAFKEKFDHFLKNKEESFHLIAERICKAEGQLSDLKDEYKKLNTQYQELLNRGANQIDRLEKIHLGPQPSQVELLKKVGIYAHDAKPNLPATTLQDEDMLGENSRRIAPSQPMFR